MTAAPPSSRSSPTLAPSLWRRLVPEKGHQRALLLSDLPPESRPPPGVKPALRFVEGSGLSFASAADEAFACSASLGGGGGEDGGKNGAPLLLRCLGGKGAWEAAGKRAAEALVEEAAERLEEEAGVEEVEESDDSSSSTSSSGIGSLSQEHRGGGSGAAGEKAEACPVPPSPTLGTEA